MRRHDLRSSHWLSWLSGRAATLAVLLAAQVLPAQVMARPGWAGSGVVAEPWWRSAVIYRIAPARFQDSGGMGRGDLAGVAQRLDYLQALGVDALLLDGASASDDGFDDLLHGASQHGLRLLLTVTPAMAADDPRFTLATVHGWLSAGAAGVALPCADRASASDAARGAYGALAGNLAALLRSFPGERVLLAEPPFVPGVVPGSSAGHAAGQRRRAAPLFAGGRSGVLIMEAALPTRPPSAAAARGGLTVTATTGDPGAAPLLRFAAPPATDAPDTVAEAALLLGSRGGALFDFGSEIGLATYPAENQAVSAGTAAGRQPLPVMQWTPANVQGPPPAPIERVSPRGASADMRYGPYRPYVHPPPLPLIGPAPAAPRAVVDGNIPLPLPAPDTLPGFTIGKLPVAPLEGDRINVATEDHDPHSPLNAYRQLIALRHGNPALRDGAEIVLHRDDPHAVVWVRRAPAGSRTAADVVAAVNLGDTPVILALDGELAGLGIHPGSLRPLFTYGPGPAAGVLPGETTHELRLPAHGVFLGEIVTRKGTR